jgi:hypothetical protein
LPETNDIPKKKEPVRKRQHSPRDREDFLKRQDEAAKRHTVIKPQTVPLPAKKSKPLKRSKTANVSKPEVPPLAMAPSADDGFRIPSSSSSSGKNKAQSVSQVSAEPVISIVDDFLDTDERKPAEIPAVESVSIGNHLVDVEESDQKPVEIATAQTMESVSLGNDLVDIEEPETKPTSVDETVTAAASDHGSIDLSLDLGRKSDSDRYEQDFDEITSPRKSDPPPPLDPSLSDSDDLAIPHPTTETTHAGFTDSGTFSEPVESDDNSALPSDLKQALGLSSSIGSGQASVPKPAAPSAAKSPDEPNLDFAFTDNVSPIHKGETDSLDGSILSS